MFKVFKECCTDGTYFLENLAATYFDCLRGSIFFSDVSMYLPNCQCYIPEDRKLYMVRCFHTFCVIFVAIECPVKGMCDICFN